MSTNISETVQGRTKVTVKLNSGWVFHVKFFPCNRISLLSYVYFAAINK